MISRNGHFPQEKCFNQNWSPGLAAAKNWLRQGILKECLTVLS